MAFTDCLKFTLVEEGGWSDNPLDIGGCTQQGITLPVYQKWSQNYGLTCTDLFLIPQTDVAQIYLDLYWTPIQGDALPVGISLMVFDMAVNAGVYGSSRILQQVLGVAADGILGFHTVSAIAGRNDTQLVNDLASAQAMYYRSRASFVTFGKGWLNRVAARQMMALAMIQLALTNLPPVVKLRTI
jgi:lysozyme family protein